MKNRRVRWRSDEIEKLMRYPEVGVNQLVKELGRSQDSITGQARLLGLRSLNRYQHASKTMKRIRAQQRANSTRTDP